MLAGLARLRKHPNATRPGGAKRRRAEARAAAILPALGSELSRAQREARRPRALPAAPGIDPQRTPRSAACENTAGRRRRRPVSCCGLSSAADRAGWPWPDASRPCAGPADWARKPAHQWARFPRRHRAAEASARPPCAWRALAIPSEYPRAAPRAQGRHCARLAGAFGRHGSTPAPAPAPGPVPCARAGSSECAFPRSARRETLSLLISLFFVDRNGLMTNHWGESIRDEFGDGEASGKGAKSAHIRAHISAPPQLVFVHPQTRRSPFS